MRGPTSTEIERHIGGILISTLERRRELINQLGRDLPLLGDELALDSFELLGLVAELERQFGFRFDDGELSLEMLGSLGTLADAAAAKCQAGALKG